ncbi:MAG: DUF4402 domain-containing protein [Anaerolineales bacterium]|nr:DUF4402 domain-containing protein [Anaerolineales bacterium]
MARKEKKLQRGGRFFVELSALVLASSGFSAIAQAQNVNCLAPLIFGDIIACSTTNTIVVRPDNTRQVNGCLTVGGAPFSRGRCTVTQSFPFRPLQITVGPSPAILTAGGPTMTVNNFNIITNAGGTGTTITAPFVNVPIGGALNVTNGQASGTYVGTLTVTANRL